MTAETRARAADIVERLRATTGAVDLWTNTPNSLRHEAAAEIERLRAALRIAEAPQCFSCGVKVTEACPRSALRPCGRAHLGGSRAALERAP